MAEIVVVGSLNCDLVMRVPSLPKIGETALGTRFDTYVGGKGCNQAIAAARAGARVAMIGCVGRDSYGDRILEALAADEVDTSSVVRDEAAGTGVAQIFVDDAGRNMIGVAPRANFALAPEAIQAAGSLISAARVVLLQLEIPVPTVLAAARLARSAGARVILNPAPAPADRSATTALVAAADVVVPNETEAEALCGMSASDEQGVQRSARGILAAGASSVVLTLGSRGALVVERSGNAQRVPAFAVDVVDTTAAGDAFCGALAAALVRGEALFDAAQWASAAGALACTRTGAEPSIPHRTQIDALASRQGT